MLPLQADRESARAAKEARRVDKLARLDLPWPQPSRRGGGRPSFQAKWERKWRPFSPDVLILPRKNEDHYQAIFGLIGVLVSSQ